MYLSFGWDCRTTESGGHSQILCPVVEMSLRFGRKMRGVGSQQNTGMEGGISHFEGLTQGQGKIIVVIPIYAPIDALRRVFWLVRV